MYAYLAFAGCEVKFRVCRVFVQRRRGRERAIGTAVGKPIRPVPSIGTTRTI